MPYSVKNSIKGVLLLAVILSAKLLCAQEKSTIRFIENKGQLPSQVDFYLKTKAGDIYFEKGVTTFSLWDKKIAYDIHHKRGEVNDSIFKSHVYKVKFVNANTPSVKKREKSTQYYNYFIGNDSSKWASNVFGFGEIEYSNIYNNIDVKYYEHFGKLKYDFIVAPEGNTNDIRLEYIGAENLKIENGNLFIKTILGNVIEKSPYAYQIIKGEKRQVKCNYRLEDNQLSFEFPEGYSTSIELIIDPVLIFSTYTGSFADNWGYSASYDGVGNMYVAGVTFSLGYPTTIGAFQSVYNGGPGLNGSNPYPGIDVAITKYSASGSSIVYSTYFGGAGNESPHSLVCNIFGELYIFGSTGSLDLPTSSNAYNTNLNGGSNIQIETYQYLNGVDAYVVKFNTSGTNIIGSTYIGGSGNDAVNTSPQLIKNYSDEFRGEIIVDASDNCWVATTSTSTDFPIVNGVQSSNNGGQDAIMFKLNPDLSNLLWSSYYGGSGDDAAYSMQLNSLNQPIITGGTVSTDLTMTTGMSTSYSGAVDGFIISLNSLGTSLLNSTYIGTSSYDQCYFVQVDLSDNVYVYGQTQGNYPITPSTVYSNPNSGQFIHKLSPDLSTTQFSTVFGSGNGVNLSPTAFLVANCDLIYVSGWGGAVNNGFIGGSTFGMPLTPDAFQNTTDGSDLYIGVFTADANNLMYGTYFGGDLSPEHVDGGTSRFDKNGTIYQAVCAGCWGNSDFPTTPGAWSNTNNSSLCNLGAIKLDLWDPIVVPVFQIDSICPGDSIQLQASGGNTYSWSPPTFLSNPNIANPIAFPPSTTTFQVIISNGCDTDTATLTIPFYNIYASPDTTICQGSITTIEAFGGVSYSWYPSSAITNPNTSTPSVAPLTTTTYYVDITSSNGCSMTDSIVVTAIDPAVQPIVSNDTTICEGDVIEIHAFGASSVSWSPPNLVSNPIAASTYTNNLLDTTTTIYVNLATVCDNISDSIQITVINTNAIIVNDTTICIGDTAFLWASGANRYSWTPTESLSSPTSNNTGAFPQVVTTYSVETTNLEGCAQTLTVTVDIYPTPSASAGQDVYIEYGDYIRLNGSGTGSLFWENVDSLSCIDCPNPEVQPFETTSYILHVTDQNGCVYSDTITVYLDGVIYVPNSFTPNGDGINDYFIIKGKEIKTFELYIFNRWGELLYTTNSLNNFWDGNYKGIMVQTDTYIWKVKYTDYQNKYGTLIGHVNVLR